MSLYRRLPFNGDNRQKVIFTRILSAARRTMRVAAGGVVGQKVTGMVDPVCDNWLPPFARRAECLPRDSLQTDVLYCSVESRLLYKLLAKSVSREGTWKLAEYSAYNDVLSPIADL